MVALSNRLRRMLFAPGTSEDVIRLVAINNPPWVDPLRLCDLGLEFEALDSGIVRYTVSNGVRYDQVIASSSSPDDEDDGLPTFPVSLENAVFNSAALLREDLTEATIDLVLVAKSDPDEIIEEVLGFEIKSGQASMETTTLEAALDPEDADEPAVAYSMTRLNAAGLYLA